MYKSTRPVHTHGERLNHERELSKHMLIHEVTKPPSSQQQHVNQLQTQLDAARRAAKLAKLNQQQARIGQQRVRLNRVGLTRASGKEKTHCVATVG